MSSIRVYSEEQRRLLMHVAYQSIEYGLTYGEPLPVNPESFDISLRMQRACFVTLEIDHTLRGCIGSLAATQALIVGVAHNAYAAAFNDPRFPPLGPIEHNRISLHISVLSSPQPLPCASERELLAKLHPGADGLILEEGHRRATFLPAVWESLPDPEDFLKHLKSKAGLPADFWSDSLRFYRYHTELID
ncbi:MAG: AMMECR1 domain-containing protein [Gammaproteobacteria bacterium RBG_16_57_12]|nr:MAG: AMMECR1 domain-containing protein [Gammaproteobacteria bacterium RBG_16_57_12]